jgi:uncharacterized membrane protein
VGAQPDSFLEGQEIVRAAIQSETAYTVDPLAAAAELAILDGEDVHPQPYIYNLIAVTPTSGDYYYNWSEAYAINNENIVTGFFNPPPNYGQWTPHAIRWVSGAPLTDLNPGSAWYTWGYGINADGWIVGKAQSTSGGDYACLWNPANNQMSYYTPLQTGTYGNEARAVNSSGVVVGSGKNTQGVVQAIQWSTGIPLYSLSIQYRSTRVSNAYGVSESGRVVGRSRGDFSSTVFHGFRTQPDLEIQPTDDLGTGTGIDTDSSEALGINSLDEAVGVTHFNTTAGKRSHAFFKTVYQGKNLGFLDLTPDKYSSRATAINNQGDVVGTYVQASGGTSKGFVRYNDGTFGDLWALTNPTQRAIWTFTTPLAINDNGWIVGVGNVNTYYGRGFILVPVY